MSAPTSRSRRRPAATSSSGSGATCATSMDWTSPCTCSIQVDEPMVVRGNFGVSMKCNRPVNDVIGDRLWLTIIVSLAAVVFTWVVALPIGIYSAVNQYSLGDYVFTFDRLHRSGHSRLPAGPDHHVRRLQVLQHQHRRPVLARVHRRRPGAWPSSSTCSSTLPLPAIILGLGGTASMIRIMRANLLDELRKPYVVTARAKGLPPTQVIIQVPGARRLQPLRQHDRLPVPYVVSGSIIVSLVLGLPTLARCCCSRSTSKTCTWPAPSS